MALLQDDNDHRIVIVEDNDELRQTYERLLNGLDGFRVVNAYSNCEDALRRLEKDNPDLVLIDLSLPGMGGIEGTMRIRKINPKVKVLINTIHDDIEHVFEAFCAGAIGYITKNPDENDLVHAIRQALAGGAPMSPKIASLIIKSFHRNPETPLTDRETVVLDHLSKGKTYSYIAFDMGISKDTVKTHIKHIYDKLEVSNKSEALLRARKDNLV